MNIDITHRAYKNNKINITGVLD